MPGLNYRHEVMGWELDVVVARNRVSASDARLRGTFDQGSPGSAFRLALLPFSSILTAH